MQYSTIAAAMLVQYVRIQTFALERLPWTFPSGYDCLNVKILTNPSHGGMEWRGKRRGNVQYTRYASLVQADHRTVVFCNTKPHPRYRRYYDTRRRV